AAPARADAPPDPLRLVPAQADLVVKIEQPRKLVESVYYLDLFKQFQKEIEAVRELYDSTNARRFYQLVAYFEKQLGVSRFGRLDRLAGCGAAVAVKFAKDPTPVLLVIQSKDEQFLHKFAKLALEVTEQELARQEAKEQLRKAEYRNTETVSIGKQFHAAVVGSALLVSNVEKALRRGIDLHVDGGKNSAAQLATPADARKLLPADPLAWAWLNLEPIRKLPELKGVFDTPPDNPQTTIFNGGLVDLLRRSPFVSAGVYKDSAGFLTTLRLPRGWEGMPAEVAALPVPPPGTP